MQSENDTMINVADIEKQFPKKTIDATKTKKNKKTMKNGEKETNF